MLEKRKEKLYYYLYFENDIMSMGAYILYLYKK